MKKYLLFIQALAISGIAVAQEQTTFTPAMQRAIHPAANKAVPRIKTDPNASTVLLSASNPTVQARTAPNTTFHEEIIGETYYDLQTNSSVGRRLSNNGDGTLSAVWTLSVEQTGFTDRGAGYNYYDGTNWDVYPTSRIENGRTGWPSIGVSANNTEMIISHNTAVSQLHLSSRNPKGTGTWNQNTSALTSPIAGGNWWPSLAVGGGNGNSFHAISITYPVASGGSIYLNQDAALLYSRSQDAGATWDIVNDTLPGLGANNYYGFSADDYAIDARGNHVAIVVGGPQTDVVLLRSSDNGDNWTRTVIDPFPIAAYDYNTMMSDTNGDMIADTIVSNDGSMAVVLDNNNTAHVFWGRMRMLDDNSNTGYFIFPVTDGLMYWNENMGSTSQGDMITSVIDRDNDGILGLPSGTSQFPLGSYGVSMTSFASAGVDANNHIYLSYAGLRENTDDGFGRAYRTTFVMKSTDQGATWSNPTEVYVSDFDEQVFPSMARLVDSDVHLIYQRDGVAGPGAAANGDEGNESVDEIIYTRIPVTAVGLPNPVGVKENETASFGMYPNPSNGQVRLVFNTETTAATEIRIFDQSGKVAGVVSNQVHAGLNQVDLDLSHLKAGLYLVRIVCGDKTSTQKLIIQ